MKRILISAALVLAACSEQEVGQSAYFDPWENPQISPVRAAQSPEVLALNAQIEAKRREKALQQANRDGDAALVASLEAAIQTAGNDAAQTREIMPSIGETPGVMTTQVAPTTQVVVEGSPQVEIQPVAPVGDGTISDNSFSTVTQQQTIESDRERLAALSQSTVVLEAEPLPERQSGPNLAAFAISTSNRIGERIYRRSFRGSASKSCRKYGNADAAQRAFLSQGGPQNDPLKLDPDGDGFVCGWSPVPFRNLKVGG